MERGSTEEEEQVRLYRLEQQARREREERERLVEARAGRRPTTRDYVNENRRAEIDLTSKGMQPFQTDEAVAALVELNRFMDPYPEAYLQGNILSRVTQYEGRTRLEYVRKQSLVELLSLAARFYEMSAKGLVEKPPPSWLAQTVLERRPADLPGIPQVERVVDVPTFGEDRGAETVAQTEPGYSPNTRTFLEPAPEIAGRLHELPDASGSSVDFADMVDRYEEFASHHELTLETAAGVRVTPEVSAAMSTLLYPFAQFPFADAASGANFLAMVIEPFVRSTIGPYPTPMYVFKASTPGTGKSLLCQAGLYIGTGDVPPASWHADRDEFDKRLTAFLLTGPAAIRFDNVNDPIDSPSLAAMLTATEWMGRRIGTSQVPDINIRCTWALTSNNPTISREMTRRTVPIILEYEGDPTARRDFEIPDLMGYVRDHRIELIGAVHTLVRNWLASGQVDHEGGSVRHEYRGAFLPSYERWVYVLGSILSAAGMPYLLGNIEDWAGAVSPDEAEFAGLLAAWHERRTGPVTAAGLASLLVGGEIEGRFWPPVELPAVIRGSKYQDTAAALVYLVLRNNTGTRLGGYRILQEGKAHGGALLWDVERVD